MNKLTLLYFVTSKQPKNERYPQKSIQSIATANTTHQEYTSRCTYVPLLSKPLKICIFQLNQIPSGPVYTRKHTQVFRIYKTDLNMKIHFKTTWRKRLRIPSRTKLRRYICIHGSPHWPQILSNIHGFFTLAANNNPQIIRSKNNFDRQVYPS